MAKVEQIISSTIASVTPSTPISQVAQKMMHFGMSIMPVCENGRFRGIITESSIISKIVATANNPKRACAKSLMTNGIPKIQVGCDVAEAAKIMANHQVHCLPVVHNGGRFLGLLTLNDLVKENIALGIMVLTDSNKKVAPSR